MFTPFLKRYYTVYIGEGNMPSTADQAVEKVGRILNVLAKDYGVRVEGEKIIGVNASVLLSWYDDMTQRGLKMTTKNNYVVLLNSFLKSGAQRRFIEKDPEDEEPIYKILTVKRLPKADEVPVEERKKKTYTKEEVLRLMESISGKNAARDKAILALLLGSGIRVSELCSLNLSSVLNQPRGVLYLKRKGGSWKHTPVAEYVYRYLDEYLKERDLSDPAEPLFLTSHGNRCTRRRVYYAMRAREQALGLPTGVHIFRHTMLSNVEKKGGLSAARDIANHSSFAMTNLYTHTTLEERIDAVNQLDWCDDL